jgi:lipopolysaccharide cholinephosphotransferase
MGRLGRAYRDGKGVEKDLNKAIEWMRKASEQGLSWAKWELCDLLLSDKTDEGFRETIREIFSNNGAKEYTIHQSLTTNKKIINKYILRTVNGIFDYAWSINDSNLLKQLLLVDTINLNDKNNARVSKIYFDGVITSRSLKKSFQLLSCSITGEVAQAKDYDNLPIDQFFRELPKSVGPLRLLQQTSISLLEELIEICSINGIKYWAVGGTLIGSVRHQGFIPWDDDIDIGILRDDIIKLQKIVKDDYPHLRLSEEYWMYEGPHHVYNLSYRGYESIFRIDIFIFDLCNTENTLWSEMIKSRRQLCMDVKNYLSIKKLNPRVHRIMDQDVINDIDKMIQKNNPNFIGEFREKGVIWAIDNMSLPEKKKRLFDYDSIFPTKQMPFENIMIDVPKDYELFLKLGFGDYYTLPSDIFDHRHNSLSSNDVEKLLNLRSTLDSKNSNSVT